MELEREVLSGVLFVGMSLRRLREVIQGEDLSGLWKQRTRVKKQRYSFKSGKTYLSEEPEDLEGPVAGEGVEKEGVRMSSDATVERPEHF